MKASVDPDRCRGHGICTTVCPDVFFINEDGYSEVTVPEIPAELQDAVRDAIEQCPEQAIEES